MTTQNPGPDGWCWRGHEVTHEMTECPRCGAKLSWGRKPTDPKGPVMTFWRSNKISGEFTAEIAGVAAQFWASRLGQDIAGGLEMRLERALRAFLTDPEDFDAVWEDEVAFSELFEQVYATWPKRPQVQVKGKQP